MSGTTVILRPTADVATNAAWTYTGGPTTVWGVTSDELDSTYATANGTDGKVDLGWGAFTMPAGAQIRSVALAMRSAGTGGYFSAGITYSGAARISYFTTGAKPPSGITAYAFKPMTLTPDGYPWTAAIINRVVLKLSLNIGVKAVRAELDVLYNEQPVVSAVTPTGTITTAQPTIGWTYSDPEGDLQERWVVRVFDDPLPSGFNPETSAARVDSKTAYVGAAAATSWTVPKALPPGVYDVYVKASDAGSAGRYSQWATAKFTVAGSPPAPPTLVSAVADQANGRNVVTVEQTDNLLTWAEHGGEELTGGYLRWSAVSGISAGPTVVAGTGNAGSNGIQATVSAATCQFRTPIGTRGRRVQASKAYAWTGSIKNSAAAGTARLDLEWYDSTGTLISVATGTTVTLSTSLQPSTGTATSPGNAVYGLLRWNGLAGLTSGQTLTVDENMIRRGSTTSPVYRGGLDSTNLLDPQDSTWTSTSLTGTSWAIVGTGSLAAVSSANAYDTFELQVAPGTVGGSHTLKLGTPVLLPVPGGQPNGSYQFQAQARAAAGANLKADLYLYFLDGNDQVVGAPVYGGQTTLAGTTYVPVFATVFAPAGAVKCQPQLVLSAEAATTDRWGFDSLAIIRVPDGTAAQVPWRPASQVDTFALVEYSDDGGTTWAPVRWTETSTFDPATRLAVVYDYEAVPNTARTYRARAGATDYQIDPVAGAGLTSAPSSTASATLPVVGWWLVDPFTQTRVALPVTGSVPVHAPQPQGEFSPLGRPFKVVVSDVSKGDELSLSMLFRTGAAFKAFDVMRDTGHVLWLQSDQADAWYVRLGDSRDAELLNSTARVAAGGIYQVAVRAVQVDRPA